MLDLPREEITASTTNDTPDRLVDAYHNAEDVRSCVPSRVFL